MLEPEQLLPPLDLSSPFLLTQPPIKLEPQLEPKSLTFTQQSIKLELEYSKELQNFLQVFQLPMLKFEH